MKNILKVNLFFLVLVLLQIFGGYLLRPIIGNLHINIWGTLILSQFLFLIIPIIIYLIVTKQSFIKVLRIKTLSFTNIVYVVVISFLVIPVMSFLGSITNLFFHNNVTDVLAQMKGLPLWAMVLVIALLPAFCEELTMRGVILSGFKKMSMASAAIISGFLFAVLHLNPPQFLYAFALGIILAYLVNITKSIFASMICHFTFNGVNAVASWVTLNSNIKAQDITAIPLYTRITTLVVLFVISAVCTFIIYHVIQSMKEHNKISENVVLEVADIIHHIIQSMKEHNKVSENIVLEVAEGETTIAGDNIDKFTTFTPIIVSIALYIIFVFKIHIGLIPMLLVLLGYFIYITYRIKVAS